MKPYFSYYGGKQRTANKIIPLIPKHTVYCEPFAGGASILFLKPFPDVKNSSFYQEIINDTNGLVYNFYKQLRDNPVELQRLINCTAYCERTYRDAVSICKGHDEIVDDIVRAWAFFININTSFGKILNAGGGRGVFGANQSHRWYSKINNLNEYLNRMQGVHISDCDALKCIQQWDSPQTFFYIDPPYVGADQGHYGGYTQKDLNSLLDLLQNIDGSFILSGYDNPNYPDIWERFEFSAVASSSGKGKVGECRDKSKKSVGLGDRKRTEIVLRHMTTKKVRPEIEKAYKSMPFQCFRGGTGQRDLF
jgi:DNA adenine methylase